MRLTDEEIEKKTEHNVGEFVDGYICGSMEAREFYENQICETCGNSNEGETISEHHVWCNYLDHYFSKNFGCNKWEPRT